MDAIRQRFLTDKVMTATPAQRVTMLYDRLTLDLARARTAEEGPDAHLDHAAQILAELRGSLDVTVGGPAENLASVYDYMLRVIMTAQLTGDIAPTASVEANVWTLREAWNAVAAGANAAPVTSASPAVPVAPRPVAALAGASWTA